MDTIALPLPITHRAQHLANQLAAPYFDQQKQMQVRLNTLAVCVVEDYLQMLAIPTDVGAADSRDPVLRVCSDVADLVIPDIGHLECRPMLRSCHSCYVPPEVWTDRIGYMVVELDEVAQMARLMGFSKTPQEGILAVEALQAPEVFIDYLAQLRGMIAQEQTAIATRQTQPLRVPAAVQLSNWFQGQFEACWQSVDALLGPDNAGYAFRGSTSLMTAPTALPSQPLHSQPAQHPSIRRVKLLELDGEPQQPIVLVVEICPVYEHKVKIYLQVAPFDRETCLPPNLAVVIIDEQGKTFKELHAGLTDNYLQYEMTGKPAEQFGIRISVGSATLTEHFIV